MKVQDIDIAHAIWGKEIAALKGNTTRKKPTHVTGDLVKVPRELVKLHKDVFMKAYILFVNGIPFFISMSRNIIFTTVNHLAVSKSNTIFKSLNKIYIYFMNSGFRIATLHVDGEFLQLQELIHDMPGGP